MALADTHAADDGQSRPSRFDDYETRTDEMQAVIDGFVDDILAAADRLDLEASVVAPDDWDHPDSWRGACEHRDRSNFQ